MTVLLVEPDPVCLAWLSQALAGQGYELVTVASGQEGLERLSVQAVDCILLSITELELCLRVKSTPGLREIPLVVMTEQEEATTAVKCLAAGADDTVGRSPDLELLRARLLAQLRRRQMEIDWRRNQQDLSQRELEAAEARAASRLAEARAVLISQLEDKNRELETFSYSISHDLRAPLRAMMGFSAALERDCGESLGEQGHFYLSRVLKAGQRMAALIEDMRCLADISTAHLDLRRCHLSQMAGQVVNELQAAHPERQVEVEIQGGMEVRADARLLQILLENLLDNAWKFTGQQAQPRISLSSPTPGQFVIRDNGAGFDMASAEKLFTPFQRLHSSSEFEGTGVGLAKVQRVISRHAGKVWAESSKGEGASFYFCL